MSNIEGKYNAQIKSFHPLGDGDRKMAK